MKDLEHCSFCGKTINDVRRLVRSPIMKATYICDSCNRLIMSIIEDGLEDEEGFKEKMRGKAHPPKMHRVPENESELCMLKPSEIHRELDRFIVGQERAKKVLSVAIYNHMKRLNDKSDLIKKSNILLVGPSGSGKTLLANTIANILNVPFATLDPTSISPTGFSGNDCTICLQQLLAISKGDVKLAERGIVYIDEIDKLAQKDASIQYASGGSAINVQAGILKMIEGCEIHMPAIGKSRGSEGNLITMNTSNILFICGGAFSGLNNTSKHGNPIGFCTSDRLPTTDFSIVNHEAIIKYGLMQELVGRLPVLVTLDDLQEDALFRILTEPEDSIIKEYQMLFEKDGINLLFDNDALKEIAKVAYNNKTGARGLRTILEGILTDIMFELPEMDNVAECRITKETVSTKIPVLESKQTSEMRVNNA